MLPSEANAGTENGHSKADLQYSSGSGNLVEFNYDILAKFESTGIDNNKSKATIMLNESNTEFNIMMESENHLMMLLPLMQRDVTSAPTLGSIATSEHWNITYANGDSINDGEEVGPKDRFKIIFEYELPDMNTEALTDAALEVDTIYQIKLPHELLLSVEDVIEKDVSMELSSEAGTASAIIGKYTILNGGKFATFCFSENFKDLYKGGLEQIWMEFEFNCKMDLKGQTDKGKIGFETS